MKPGDKVTGFGDGRGQELAGRSFEQMGRAIRHGRVHTLLETEWNGVPPTSDVGLESLTMEWDRETQSIKWHARFAT